MNTVVHFARSPSTPGLEIVHYPDLRCGWRGIPEAYTWFTLIDHLHGDVEVISRGIVAACEPGSLTIGEPGEPYVLRARSDMQGEFRVVRVDTPLLAECMLELARSPSALEFPREPLLDPAVVHEFTALYDATASGDRLHTDERLVSAFHMLAQPESRRGTRVPHEPGVIRARELLHARFPDQLSLRDLANAALLDRFTLLRAFSRELGLTPHAYQMHLRIARARRLILDDVPLVHVALQVGYSEQSAFTRAFKQLVGVTPGQYARSVLR